MPKNGRRLASMKCGAACSSQPCASELLERCAFAFIGCLDNISCTPQTTGCPQPCPGWEWVYQQGVETSQPGLAGQIKVLTCGTCLRVPWLVRSAVVGRVMTWESIAGGTAGSNGDRSLGFRDLNCWLGDVSGSCDRSRSKLAMGTGPLVSEISSAGRVISWEGGAGGGARWRW